MKRHAWTAMAAAALVSAAAWSIASAPRAVAAGDGDKSAAAGGADKGAAADKAGAAQLPLCPVMHEPVDFTVHADTKDGPVYMCCSACIEKLEKNPAKYADAVKEQRAAVAKLPRVQVVCPVSHKPINEKVSAMQDGKPVYFCCKDCKGEFEKNAAKYAGQLEACSTFQTTCPISHHPIDRSASVKLKNGNTVYFCCDKCEGAFMKNPAKHLAAMEAQGYPMQAKDVVAAGGK